MKGVKQMRTYLIDGVRKHGSQIFCTGLPGEYYTTNYNRSAVPRFVELLGSPKKPDEVYPAYPRVLFTNYEVVEKELFGSTAILNVRPSHPHSFTLS